MLIAMVYSDDRNSPRETSVAEFPKSCDFGYGDSIMGNFYSDEILLDVRMIEL